MRLDNPRPTGSVLVLAIVIVGVLAVLAVAGLSMSHTEMSGAKAFRSGDELAGCAEAGRQYLLSMFRRLEMPLNLVIDKHLESATGEDCPASIPEGSHCVRSGHLGQVVTGVKLVPQAMSNQRDQRDLTNIISRYNLGAGQQYQVVVHCTDSRGRETEIEFALRFGL